MIAAPAYPIDRAKTEHLARVNRVIYQSPEGDFVILALDDNTTAIGNASSEDFEANIKYRFLGRWEDDPRRGPRFRFSTFTIQGFLGRTGIAKYLCDLCENIGPKTVEKLWNQYGSETVQKLRESPAEVAETCGINREICESASGILLRHKAHENTKIELHNLFAGRGFTGKLIDVCIDRWGAKAASVIQTNPFRLMRLPSAGFKRCDKLWLDLGLRRDSLKRQVMCTVEAIRRDRFGHTWLDAESLAASLKEMIPSANAVKAFKCALRARLLGKFRDAEGRLWLTTAERAMAERMITAHIHRLSSAKVVLWPTDQLTASKAEGDGLPSEHQLEHLARATTGAVGLYCGSPGTGKTHSLAYLLKELIAEYGRSAIAVMAPTGKAAVRAKQALRAAGVDLPTSTIHSALIQCGALTLDGTDNADLQDQLGFIEARFVIVDETSMVDATLMAVLLSSLMTGTHVLFVGDPYQLPPVGHGSPLRDLIAAGLPHGELSQVRRNAGQIVHACLRIKNGEEFETCNQINLDCNPPQNLRLIEARDEKETVETLESVLRCLRSFHPVWNTQVIIARNKGGILARKELNERLQGVLNPDGRTVPGNPFRVGDKIICLKNSRQTVVALAVEFDDEDVSDPACYETVYAGDEQDSHLEPVESYLANGEIGRVVAIGPKVTIARFSEADCLVRIPMGGRTKDDRDSNDDDEGRGCNFDLAYAVTCHKLQGSSAPCVIVVGDPNAGGVTNREWLYTAISRAGKLCLMIGGRGLFMKMVGRVATTRRKTFLTEQVRQALAVEDAGTVVDADTDSNS